MDAPCQQAIRKPVALLARIKNICFGSSLGPFVVRLWAVGLLSGKHLAQSQPLASAIALSTFVRCSEEAGMAVSPAGGTRSGSKTQVDNGTGLVTLTCSHLVDLRGTSRRTRACGLAPTARATTTRPRRAPRAVSSGLTLRWLAAHPERTRRRRLRPPGHSRRHQEVPLYASSSSS